ncbi:serine/threonine protein kinase [Halobacillus sp. A5]|uniref:serine/threonine protein kinase n=1 Tax=Halobacillus sp. A5 TaxID=2880263 RepID=UPI0020A6A721|nr:serine/threonine protein kinase [Halobacillus sp. A5]MCP3028216.1 serine/threonine protein kinase [Halobacillus sp. A5]
MKTKSIAELVQGVRFVDHKVKGVPAEFTLIGQGRSAAVFKLDGVRPAAVKVFYTEFRELAFKEASIYAKLANHVYYPELIEAGEGYLVLEYLQGITFYDCLVSGVSITPVMVAMVDEALDYARKCGLNPSDTHLKNIILTPDHKIKVIDVVRFTQSEECPHWSDLKKAYYSYYQKRYFPKRFTPLFIEFIIRLYRKRLLPI